MREGVAELCRTRLADHWRENLAGAATPRGPADIEVLRQEFAPQQERSEVFALR